MKPTLLSVLMFGTQRESLPLRELAEVDLTQRDTWQKDFIARAAARPGPSADKCRLSRREAMDSGVLSGGGQLA